MSETNKNTEENISQYDKLVIDISNNLTTRLSDLMSKLLNSAEDKLFNMSDEADNNEEQRRYFELMNQIRILKPTIADSFNKNIKEYLIPAKEFENRQKKQKSNDDELSLVDQEEMESIVLVKGIGGRATAKYREQLSHLEARLEHLSLKITTVFKKDALVPINFCQAFDDALADDFDNTNKKLLFGMFDVEVANKLDALYDSLNNRLIDAGILPQIKLHMSGQKSSPPRPKAPQTAIPDANDITQQHDFAEGASGGGYPVGGSANAGAAGGNTGAGGSSSSGNNVGGFAMTAAPGGTYRHANQNSAQSQAGGSKTGPTGNAASNPSASGSGYAGGNSNGNTAGRNTSGDTTEYQHYTAGMPANQVGRVLGNYIGAPFTPNTLDKSSKEHGEFFLESTNQHFGHQEIIQALSNIQSQPQFDHPEETRFDSEAIKQAVLAEIAKTSGGAVTKRINQIAEKTIDFIELIFDAIIDDEDISDTIKTQLLRLQIPIIKASMSDQEFFIYDNHPARILLDTIAEAGVGVTGHGDDIYKHLNKIISNILSEYELSTETFQTALNSLNDYIEEQESNTRAKEEEEQKQLLRKHSRATVLKALRATTAGKTLPEAVHPLILKRWPTLLFNHYLSNGKENNEWINMVFTLRHIVDSVQPITSAEHLAKLISEKDALFETTENYLNISSNSKKDVQNIMDLFLKTVQENIDDANFSEEEISAAEEMVTNAEPVKEQPIEEDVAEKPVMPPNVMPGMWFQIYMGEDQIPRRCKLSVIIVEDANLMFVNQKGELVTEKSFDDFNQEVKNNTTKMIMGHSAFDHAFKTVIDRLN